MRDHRDIVQVSATNSTTISDGDITTSTGSLTLHTNIVITDGYVEDTTGLGISAGLNNINLHSKVVHNGPNDSQVILDAGDVRLSSYNNPEVSIKDLMYSQVATNWTTRTTDGPISTALEGIDHDGYNFWVAAGVAGEVQTSPDGRTWTAETIMSGTPNMNSVWADTDLTVFAGGGGIYTTTDYTTYTQQDSGVYEEVIRSTSGRYVVVADIGIIKTSQDAITWTARSPESVSSPDFNFVLQADNGDIIVAGNEIEISTDDGTTWSNVESSPPALLYCLAKSGNIIFAGGNNGALMESLNGGNTWTDVSSRLSAFDITPILSMVASGPMFVFFCNSSAGTKKCFYSTDYGQTWKRNWIFNNASFIRAAKVDGNSIIAVGDDALIEQSIGFFGMV